MKLLKENKKLFYIKKIFALWEFMGIPPPPTRQKKHFIYNRGGRISNPTDYG